VLGPVYASDAAGKVRKLVEQSEYVAFLTFDLDRRPNAVSVTINAPEAARDSVDVLFGHFLSGFGCSGRSARFGGAAVIGEQKGSGSSRPRNGQPATTPRGERFLTASAPTPPFA
jgi:hypothetical protein